MRIRDKIRHRMRSTSIFTLLKTNLKVNIKNIKTKIRKNRNNSPGGKVFSVDYEVETGTTNDEGIMEVCVVWTLVYSSSIKEKCLDM